jgi:hypothetical protein
MWQMKKIFKKARPWQVVGLTGLVAVVIIISYGTSTLWGRGGAQQPPPPEGSPQVAKE